jgi:hypothetical protein
MILLSSSKIKFNLFLTTGCLSQPVRPNKAIFGTLDNIVSNRPLVNSKMKKNTGFEKRCQIAKMPLNETFVGFGASGINSK